MNKLSFASDYMEGAYPSIIARLTETNLIKTPGYGTDEITESAKARSVKPAILPTRTFSFSWAESRQMRSLLTRC